MKTLFPPLQRTAERYNTALLGLWGSPKRQGSKEAYDDVRLAASGGAEIARQCATSADVKHVKGEPAQRLFTVDTHRSAADVYNLMFSSPDTAWLTPLDPIALAKQRAGGSTDLVTNLKALGFRWNDVEGKLKGVSRATWFRKG